MSTSATPVQASGTSTAQGTSPTSTSAPLPLRRNRDYLLLQGGATVSALGSGMTGLAFLLLGFALTHSAARASLVAASFGLGELLLMLPAGALADRWNRRALMVGTAVAGAVAFATIPLADHYGRLGLAQLAAVAFVEGTLGCFYGPAERAALKRIVAPEQLGSAVSTAMARSSLGELVGPPLSGVLYGVARTLPFLADAATFLVAAACAASTRTPLPAPARTDRTHVLADIRTGLQWVWRTRAVRDIMLVGMPLNLAINGVLTVAVLALQKSGTTGRALGLMEGAAGLAALAAAVVAPAVIARVRIGLVAIAGVAGVVLVGCLMPVSTSIWWVGALLAVAMAVVMPVNAGIGAYQMHITPDEMQGRSASAASFVAMAMVPLGTGSAGLLLTHLGRTHAMLVYAGVFAIALLVALTSRALREIPTTASFTASAE